MLAIPTKSCDNAYILYIHIGLRNSYLLYNGAGRVDKIIRQTSTHPFTDL